MGKTFRRKSDKKSGYYEWMDEVRNRQGAGESYYHSDMPSRRGRWRRTVDLKNDSNNTSRSEKLLLSKKLLQTNDVDEVDTTHQHLKQKYSDPWFWD